MGVLQPMSLNHYFFACCNFVAGKHTLIEEDGVPFHLMSF